MEKEKTSEKVYVTPIWVQFNSEVVDGKFYRIGEPDKEMTDAIYRVDANNINQKELVVVVDTHNRNTKYI